MLRAVQAGDAEGFFESVGAGRRPAAHLRSVADLHARCACGPGPGACCGSTVSGRTRGAVVTFASVVFSERAAPETPPSEWTLPKLRIDVDGDVVRRRRARSRTPGILANLRGNLRRDGDGHFIQTRVRIPVEVATCPSS